MGSEMPEAGSIKCPFTIAVVKKVSLVIGF